MVREVKRNDKAGFVHSTERPNRSHVQLAIGRIETVNLDAKHRAFANALD
jgi:hypothetical protein